jgi:hypothetical protein
MDELNCKSVRRSMWDYMARSAGGADPAGNPSPREIALHLSACRDCQFHGAEVRSLRSGLRHLPLVHVPPILATRLQILASRERARLLARRDLDALLGELKSLAKLFFDNLLKPFAVPAAGGILASFLCFGLLVDTLQFVPDWQNDIPLGLFTDVMIDEPSPFSCNGSDVMVQLTVDSGGQVTDYALPQDRDPLPDELMEIGNLVRFTSFTPAKRFGQPISSKRLFLIRHISIKG